MRCRHLTTALQQAAISQPKNAPQPAFKTRCNGTFKTRCNGTFKTRCNKPLKRAAIDL
jgi:hypothetical protein